VLVEDHRVGPAQTAMMRLDFASWLSTLSHRDHQVAEVLASGESARLPHSGSALRRRESAS
jgi:hypothetical protein